jgi:hypothetical protein
MFGPAILGACAAEELTCPLIGCPPPLTVRLEGDPPPAPWRVELTQTNGALITFITCEANATTRCPTVLQTFFDGPALLDRVVVRITTSRGTSRTEYALQYGRVDRVGPRCGTCPVTTLSVAFP